MQANRETSQKRREFLSRTGVLAVTALPIGAGFTPRVLLAEGCGVAKLGLVAGATMTTIGMASKSIPGTIVGLVGIGIVGSSYKECIEEQLQELEEGADEVVQDVITLFRQEDKNKGTLIRND